MLYMVIERFKNGDIQPVSERFQRSGRLLPDGVSYVVSWLDEPGTVCYQVMESPSRELLDRWLHKWNDLVDFEVVPVLTSAEFWSRRAGRQASS